MCNQALIAKLLGGGGMADDRPRMPPNHEIRDSFEVTPESGLLPPRPLGNHGEKYVPPYLRPMGPVREIPGERAQEVGRKLYTSFLDQ